MQRQLSQDESNRASSPAILPASILGKALFLDVDGTLIDIAPTPESVHVPADLAGVLGTIANTVDGAVAVVSGRSIENIDQLLRPARLAAAGLHGSEFRAPGGHIETLPPPPALESARPQLVELARRLPGVHIEDKGPAIAVHFRAVPEAAEAVEQQVSAIASESDGSLAAQKGKMVFELKPAIAGKGHAVERFMTLPEFAERMPIAIGDDFTDEDMFRIVNSLGGLSVRVGENDRPTAAQFHVESPAALRSWLASLGGTD